ncbi:hypothetical protein DRJ48_02185 [Candidatus Woesearchaeota archaeon]|nr:MAG: hypothetical protein DRJ48_02185 [Candidatus Woesearchaeota archaeon]
MLQKMKPLNEINRIYRNIVLVFSILALFIFLVAFSVYYVSDAINKGRACGCVVPIPVIIVLLSSLGFFVGGLVYYILATRFTKEKADYSKRVAATLNFLPPDERDLVRQLIKHNGTLNQASLAKEMGWSRVKTHRVLNRLINKGIVEKSSVGNTNKVQLNRELVEIF